MAVHPYYLDRNFPTTHTGHKTRVACWERRMEVLAATVSILTPFILALANHRPRPKRVDQSPPGNGTFLFT